uniref:Uncharacterized protein n=1 Tax=Alexandrium monilatum TaxID=311494 RepID=A0A7S4T178_9DINO
MAPTTAAPTAEALIGEVRHLVTEQLRLFKESLLQKHEEHELKLEKLFDSLLERRHSAREGAVARLEESELNARVAPQEPRGLERIGKELARLQQHVSKELSLISREVVLERAARARDPHKGRASVPRPAAAGEYRNNSPQIGRLTPERSGVEREDPPRQQGPVREEVMPTSHSRERTTSKESAHGGCDADEAGRKGEAEENSPKGLASWQKGLTARERACMTPLEHLGLSC